MAWHIEKGTDDIVIDGFNKGIAPSPHLGIANMQCVNIQTEIGEVMANFARARDNQQPISGGTFTANSANDVTYSGATTLKTGAWVHVTASTITNLSTGYYWITGSAFNTGKFSLYTYYKATTQVGSLGTTGTATFDTVNMGAPIANQGCIEQYTDSSGANQERYYVATTDGQLWVYDTNPGTGIFADLGWSIASNQSDITSNYSTGTGLAVLNGQVLFFQNASTGVPTGSMYFKPTFALDTSWSLCTSLFQSPHSPHFAFVNHNNYCFVTDGDFLTQIFPSCVSSAGNVNQWAYGNATINSDTFQVGSSHGGYLAGGNFPVDGATIFFYTSNGGSTTNFNSYPSTTASGVLMYYVVSASKTNGTFKIASSPGGSALTSLSNSGFLYFNTFWPNPNATDGASPATPNPSTIATEALQLAPNEVSQSLTELGSSLLIGCQSNNVYNWNEVAISGGGTLSVVQFPESNVTSFVQANNVAYAFAGNKGNIYVTNGSFVSTAMTVPDYTAGVAGSPTTYIEPYFTWGGTAFMRGRIWFSIQDQTSSKTGNCGGVWSFVPSFFDPLTGTDQGMALRMETQNSYGTYNGRADIILPLFSQVGIGAQYYTAWVSDQSSGSATYGIDGASPDPYTGGQTIIESDLIPTGQLLGTQKKTFSGIEFKLAAPLQTNEKVQIKVRQNGTSDYKEIGNYNLVRGSGGALAAYYSPITFEKGLWLQLQIILTSVAYASSPSFCRLLEVRIHQ